MKLIDPSIPTFLNSIYTSNSTLSLCVESELQDELSVQSKEWQLADGALLLRSQIRNYFNLVDYSKAIISCS